MTKAPKSTSRKKKPAPEAVEDAVVIEDTEAPDEEKPAEEAKEPEPDAPAPDEPSTEPEPEAETAPEPESEPEPEETPTPAPAPAAKKRGGTAAMLGFVTGGILAAVIGFAAARYVVPEGWPFPGVTPEPDPVALAVEAQGQELAALKGDLAGIGDSVAALQADTGLEDLKGELAGVNATLSAQSDRLDEIVARLEAVEKLAPEGSAAAQMAAEAYDRELVALREMFASELAAAKAAQADAAALETQAANAATAAAARAALAKVTTALDNGQPFAAALADLTTASGIAVPAALADQAEEGVSTLAALQDGFPPVARAALEAAIRAGIEDGSIDRWTGFFRIQLGTRSLEPKEGDDPDAVLSRAEAALKQGDIAGALSELDAMPEAAGPALSDWIALAQTRLAALEAGARLADELNLK